MSRFLSKFVKGFYQLWYFLVTGYSSFYMITYFFETSFYDLKCCFGLPNSFLPNQYCLFLGCPYLWIVAASHTYNVKDDT